MKPHPHPRAAAVAPSPKPKAASHSKTNPPEANTPNSLITDRIPSEWKWHYRTLLHLRDRLMRSHADHSKEAIAPSEMLGVDVVDTTQDRLDRDLLWAELANDDSRLFEVDCALQRIHDGTYGVCEETGRAILPERLRAVPWTRYCRTAAEKQETSLGRSSRPGG
ncbi:MAG: TraR/DksA family transcriptional regulator [Opitutus sp.]